MPIYDVQAPDGKVYSVEAPEGTPQDQIFAFVSSQMGQFNAPKPQEGIGAALTGGFKRFLSSGETTLESIINPELAAQRGAERSERLGEQYAPGASLERVKQAYEQQGLIPAAKEIARQIPSALAEQAPNIAATLGMARTGAMLGAPIGGPVGALVGGVAGAALPSLVQLYGANLERQFEEKAPEISRAGALGAAVPGAALEVASQFIPLGRGWVGKLLGPNAEKALARGSNEAIERAAKESLTSSLATGTITGALAEIPTEVAQQMLERLQAGLSITDEEAQKEYGEAAYGAALVGGPFGAAARGLGRPGARAEFDKVQQEEQARLAVSEEELAQRFPEGALPGGFRIDREEIGREMGPAGFSIMAEGREEPLSVVDTQEEADAKLESLTKIRQEEANKLLGEEQKINAEVEKTKARIEQLEATEQTDSEEYKSLKAGLPSMMEDSAQKIADLYDRAQTLSKPLTAAPFGETERVNEQFNVIDQAGKAVGSYKTLGEAEASIKDVVGSEEFDRKIQAQETAKQLYKTFVPQMRKFGLGDVGLNIVDQIENGAGGAYLDKLIKVSLEDDAPVQTMRHESLHALKDLGFFTPQQWKALEERASKEWIKKYLEGQETEIDGQKMSRLEGYRKLGYSEQDIVEEAIADAFGDYDKGVKPPPGLIAALFKKLKNFFANFGQALRGAGFQSADDIFQQVERGTLKPAKTAAKAEPVEKLSLKTIDDVINDGVDRLVKSARKNRLRDDRDRFMPGNGRADTNLTKIQDGIENRLKELGMSQSEVEDIIYQKVLPAYRAKLKEFEDVPYGQEKFSLPIMRGEEKAKFEAPPKEGETEPTKIKPTVDAVGKYFDDQVKERNGNALDYNDKQSFDQAVKTASDEVAFQLDQEKSGLDWYEDDIKEAFKQTKKYIPDLGKTDNRLLFSVVAGIMSPQTTARDNWFIAAKAFEHYIDTKDIPGNNPETGGLWQGGTQSPNKKIQLEFLDRMVKDMGQKKALEWLFQDHTVKEINEFRSKYGNIKSGIGGKMNDMVPGLYAFGPKVGPFVANLNGIHDVTVDKWMTRTFNRYFGTMTDKDGKIVDAPTEPQRRAIKALVNEVAKNAGIKPYQVQSLLWFYEQRLFTEMGVKSPSYGFSDGGRKFAESRAGGGEKGVSPAPAPAKGKLSIKRGVIAEVAPNPDHIAAEKWREMTPAERLDATKAVANKVITPIFGELDLKGYSFEFSSGKYEGEVNPNIIIKAPKDATVQQLDELARVVGYVLDQKAMVTFDEENTTSGSQAGFVKVVVPKDMTPDQLTSLREHIAREVPQASGDTLRDSALIYGNFSEYDPSVDTLTNDEYHQALISAVESFDYDGTIRVSEPEVFHSDLIEAKERSGYLEGTRYGEGREIQGEEGADVRRQGRRRLENLAEQAIVLRDRWIDARGAARNGGRERTDAQNFGEPTAEYGSPRADAVSAIGVHFSKQYRPQINSAFFGSGLRGMEAERLSGPENADLRNRIYFYVDKGRGIRPEAGVGGVPHVIKLNNLYDSEADPLGIIKGNRGETMQERMNGLERKIMKAGFDGMLFRDKLQSQDYAILYGKHNIKTEGKLSLKRVGFPTVKEAKEAVKAAGTPDTAEFKQYNAGNQWVDADGKPKVFYHATARNFFEFTPAGQSQAIFLAETPEEAETFGSIAEDKLRKEIYAALGFKEDKLDFLQGVVDKAVEKGTITKKYGDDFMKQAKRAAPKYGDFGDIEQEVYDALLDLSPSRMTIMPLYARAMAPFDFESKEHVDQVMNWVANNTQYPQDFPEKWLAGLRGRISQGLWQAIEDKRVQQAIRALSFDGFTVRENRASAKNYAVYQPQQVKSVTGNDGQFSLETKDMRYSLKKVRYSDDRFEELWSKSMYTNADNKTKGYMAFVDPADFVKATSTPGEFDRVLSEIEPVDFAKMRGLENVPTMVISRSGDDWKIIDHQGRHRMWSLHEAGYRDVPVFINFASGIEDAKAIPVKTIRGQSGAINSIVMIAEAEPLSYANKDKAMEKFTRMESKVKYSLPPLSTNTQSRINKVAPQRYTPGWKERVIGAFKQDYTELRQRFLNRYETLASFDRQLREKIKRSGGPDLLADQSAEFSALQSDLSAGVAASAMGIGDRQGGVPVYRNGVTTIDTSVKGMVEALAPLAKYGDPEIYQRYQFWAGWKRGRRLLAEGKERLYEPSDIAVAQELDRLHGQVFAQVQKDLVAFNDGIVNFAVQTGVLSKERARVYTQYADYIPFYRQLELDKTIGPNPFGGISGVKGPKAIKGGESPLGDFMENMVRNTQSMINAGMKNAAAQRATKVALQLNEVQRLPGPVSGVGVDAYTQLENGQLVYYRAGDPLFIDALKSLNMPDLPFMGILSAPANALRNLVTKDPGFMLANLLRDSLSSYVTSGQNVTPIVGTMVNFGKALSGKDKNLQALFNAGVIGGYEFSQNIQQSGKSLSADLNKKAGTDSKLLRPFKSLWEGLEKGTTASDAATRMAVYERVMKETNGNEAEAISRALEVMNFNRKGSSILIRVATAALPFFNARLQGLDLFYRASTGRMDTADAQEIKRKFWVRGMTMASLSAMYYMSVAGDDEYEKQEEETKDNNWIFPSLGIRIPIPFEVGTLFKTMPERITAYMMGNDTGKDLSESTLRALANTFALNPIPQTFKPLVEVATNYNFFTMRPIVGQGMQDVAPQFQVGPGTSKTAEWIGDKLGLSPLKLDQLIKGYTGTMGGYVIDVVDAMASEFSDVPKASKRLEQMPIIKRFALDPEARGSVTQFYELQKSVDTFVRTSNLLEKTARPEEYAKYVQENIDMLGAKDYVRETEKVMKELRDMKKVVNSLDMKPDEKRDLLVDIGRAETSLTANIKTIKKAVSELK